MRFFVRLLFFVAIYAAVCLLLLQPAAGSGDLKLWPGFYTLITDDGEAAEAALQDSLSLISPRTLIVRLNDFDGEMKIPLAEVQSRLIDADPRIDPFIRRLGTLFDARLDGAEADILYVERTLPLRKLEKLVQEQAAEVIVADRSEGSTPLLLLFTATTLLVLLVQRKFRLLILLSLVPWGLGILYAGREAALLALVALFAVPRLVALVLPTLLRRVHESDAALESAVRFEAALYALGLLLSMGLYAGFVSFSGFLRFPFAAALGSLSLLRLRLTVEERRLARLTHPLFLPVRLQTRVTAGGRSLTQALLAAAAMSVTVLLPTVHSRAIELPLPATLNTTSEEIEAGLAATAAMEEGKLPSLSLYLTHRYYQENYLYAPRFELPPYGAALSIDTYRRDDGRIVLVSRPVWRFTDAWYNAIIADDTDRITQFFIHDGVPRGIQRTELAATATVYGLYPGLGLLFSFIMVTLLLGKERTGTVGEGTRWLRRVETRSISQTA